jgi:tetratricopeptide (TPR) repeat protein
MTEKRESALMPVLMTVLVVVVIGVGTVFLAKSLDLPRKMFRKTRGLSEGYRHVSPKELPIARGPDATIALSQISILRQMFEEKRFGELNAALDKYQKAFEADYTREFALYDAYQIFQVPKPNYEPLLAQWIDQYPGDYQPYLAAAFYYYSKGWESRGKKFIANTTDAQIQGLHRNHSMAKERVARALEIHPRLMLAHNLLIGIHNASGSAYDEKRAIDKAIALFPQSYIIRSTAMWALQPRWGGSYQKMWSVAAEAQAYARQYPVLSALFGKVYQEKAHTCDLNEQYALALEDINKAIAYGDRSEFYHARAKIHGYDLHDYEAALEDIDYAIELRPTEYSYHLDRVRFYFAEKSFEKALDGLKTIDAIWPGNASAADWRSWASRELNQRGKRQFKTQPFDALGLFDLSLSFKRNNPEAHKWKAYTYLGINQPDAAVESLKKAIEAAPHDYATLQSAVVLLRMNGQSDAALNYINAFLASNPDHADALALRSTFFINSDRKRCLADLQKACVLGSRKACQQYENWNGRRKK